MGFPPSYIGSEQSLHHVVKRCICCISQFVDTLLEVAINFGRIFYNIKERLILHGLTIINNCKQSQGNTQIKWEDFSTLNGASDIEKSLNRLHVLNMFLWEDVLYPWRILIQHCLSKKRRFVKMLSSLDKMCLLIPRWPSTSSLRGVSRLM